jgi:mevalonate kinase
MQMQVHGKWILAGEHAVLRGSPALVFPLSTRKVSLDYTAIKTPLSVAFDRLESEVYRKLFDQVLSKACELSNVQKQHLTGEVRLSSDLPLGAGLGASAALSVIAARWMQHLGYVEPEQMYEYARQLENLFHGESSGVDVAVILQNQPLKFTRDPVGTSSPGVIFNPIWKPRWYISYSGQKGMTSSAVHQVKELIKKDASLGAELDLKMRSAVALCEQALTTRYSEQSQDLLADGISLAGSCFDRWGLAEGHMKTHLQKLRSAGALAAKPTGSGGGGYALSLWKEIPPQEILVDMISV